ncbi:hypothetical protein CDAR_13301, partial [Caerostris darwini]
LANVLPQNPCPSSGNIYPQIKIVYRWEGKKKRLNGREFLSNALGSPFISSRWSREREFFHLNSL